MPKAKLTKKVDYYVKGSKMVSYPSGYEGEMPEAHYAYAQKIGAIDGAKEPVVPPPGGDKGGK